MHKITYTGKNGTRPQERVKNETADFSIHQTRNLTTNAQPDSQHIITVKRKDTWQKSANSNTEVNRNLRELRNSKKPMEALPANRRIKESKKKHLTDGKNHFITTIKIDGTDQKIHRGHRINGR